MQINPQIFREYDVRGTVDRDLSEDFAYLLGRAFASLAKDHGKNDIAVGFDCRHSSLPYANALAKGLADEGINCCITGMGPTPQLYWALYASHLLNRSFGGGIQITGSHNPPDMNGFKMVLGLTPVASEMIQDLRVRCEKLNKLPASAPGAGAISELNIRQTYIDDLVKHSKDHLGQRKLKVVVDAGNGVGGLVGPELLKRLGVEVIELYTNPDGDFPNHHPDPTVMEYIVDLIAKVREVKADFGIGWDGDADRIGIVDENGDVIFGDMLTLIYARDVLREQPGATIIGDVKCSSRLFDDVTARKGKPIMWKTGHSLMKLKLKETKAALAGEMSGHIVFAHRFYGFDDALHCAARFVEIMTKTDKKASQLISDLPKMVSTPEIRVDCPEEIKFKIPEKAKAAFAGHKVDTTDGVRIQFEKGWGLVRASNTQPVLVMRFEAESPALLEQYQAKVSAEIEAIKRSI